MFQHNLFSSNTTIQIWMSIITNIIYPSFNIIYQGTNKYILRSESLCGDLVAAHYYFSRFISANTCKNVSKIICVYAIPTIANIMHLSFDIMLQETNIKIL